MLDRVLNIQHVDAGGIGSLVPPHRCCSFQRNCMAWSLVACCEISRNGICDRMGVSCTVGNKSSEMPLPPHFKMKDCDSILGSLMISGQNTVTSCTWGTNANSKPAVSQHLHCLTTNFDI